MGRGRGKGKKQSVITEDPGSEEDKVPAYRRRGRPLKPLTDEIEEVEVAETIEKDEENVKGNNGSTNELKTQPITINKRKRKRSTQVKEKIDPMKDDNGILAKSGPDDSIKSTGFRQNGSRRKNKPRRAAEAGVDCK
ncbi:uncharacterized protein LOC124831313 [Vigna umbellata]|uniref:Uncharacterized protein n=2 Tax=Phaseolus angularis TaxID=3914 RepID=A0A0L9U844_PHAAN|nr:uncharacterized protein LOC108327976 [Vigna angularis]XP_017417219.1 uncharacterized protein LOC108327976 [Vigna angularis]XP_047161217.1 uncharacterized protein LOC124831313 [Vigna umbellata]XP_047161218.1 uncharacterized protein LOC124831313 [Vigna umbellata]BAT85327.1 hypothetical protein VIGAN_04286200 [Vigna angularis var. angularis]KAG2405696.1 uncharacterized protein HKW66_Vig0049510 [Vigna angularis]KOM38837.1 hypothetical protein LR48_Vigan03g221900 [Vigna angularis]